MPASSLMGFWSATAESPRFNSADIVAAARRCRERTYVIQEQSSGAIGVGFGGDCHAEDGYRVLAVLPPLFPEWLGDRSFTEQHGLRFPYVAGAMANGIATVELVVEMANSGCLGFFGAAGLSLERVEEAVDALKRELDPKGLSWGSNLIHSPNEPELEQAVVDLYLQKSVLKVSAAAYMKLTLPLVQYAATGLCLDECGRIQRRHSVFAKVSRPEVARHFMSPPPAAMLETLIQRGAITKEEARLASTLPVAEDFTVEADSGGHTDNQSAAALFPTLQRLRDEIVSEHGYARPIRLGLAGGIGAPEAVAAAFSMGAAYVLTGSINQSCLESGLHEDGKALLAKADLADVVMAPAADMFELGVDVQVLKRGTMFGVRAKKLYSLYRRYSSLEQIPAADRQGLEKNIFLDSIESAWESTRAYWEKRDPRESQRAKSDPKHKMALLFRSYLGQSSKWAIAGEPGRKMDYQIWCGPAMGAFNAWSKDSFLALPENRRASTVAMNLLEGAAAICRAQQLRSCGAPVPQSAFAFPPRRLQA